MTTSALALPLGQPLLDLLDREFERPALSSLAGGAAAAVPWRLWSDALYAPLREFLRRPGKEFRSELLAACYRLGPAREPLPLELPLALEALHAGSLIVDDIQDDSMERRGSPALHRLVGVPTALNAGNWLYFFAEKLIQRSIPAAVAVRARELVTSVLLECHHGQALDLSVRVDSLAREEVAPVVRAVTELKTGSLVGLSAGLGALAGGADEALVSAAIRFGRGLGTGLQMLDDLSGIANDRRLHKGHEDLAEGRPTWPWAWLSEQDPSVFHATQAMSRAVVAGGPPESLSDHLRRLVVPLGMRRVHETLDEALGTLTEAAPGSPVPGVLRREIDRLEKSYV